jgi:hypothetical protein
MHAETESGSGDAVLFIAGGGMARYCLFGPLGRPDGIALALAALFALGPIVLQFALWPRRQRLRLEYGDKLANLDRQARYLRREQVRANDEITRAGPSARP